MIPNVSRLSNKELIEQKELIENEIFYLQRKMRATMFTNCNNDELNSIKKEILFYFIELNEVIKAGQLRTLWA